MNPNAFAALDPLNTVALFFPWRPSIAAIDEFWTKHLTLAPSARLDTVLSLEQVVDANDRGHNNFVRVALVADVEGQGDVDDAVNVLDRLEAPSCISGE